MQYTVAQIAGFRQKRLLAGLIALASIHAVVDYSTQMNEWILIVLVMVALGGIGWFSQFEGILYPESNTTASALSHFKACRSNLLTKTDLTRGCVGLVAATVLAALLGSSDFYFTGLAEGIRFASLVFGCALLVRSSPRAGMLVVAIWVIGDIVAFASVPQGAPSGAWTMMVIGVGIAGNVLFYFFGPKPLVPPVRIVGSASVD